MQSSTPEKKRYSLSIRIIAGVLAASLLLGLSANGFVRVRIQEGEQSEAATNYLVENTDYVSKGTQERLKEKLQTLTSPSVLEDYYRMAGTQIAEENYPDALESIEACMELDPKLDPALTQDLLMKQGCLLVLLEQYDRALTVLDEVSVLSPEYGEVYLVKAQIYAQRNQADLLAETLGAYLALVPGDAQIRLVLAQTWFSLERFQEAKEQYRILLEEDTPEERSQIQYLYALTEIQLGGFAEAEENLTAAGTQNPELEGLYYYLGVCQMAREAYQEAAENLTRSIESGSMAQLSYYSRGVCGLVLEDYDVMLALEDLQKAADYAGADVDPSISQQATTLLEQLLTIPEETIQ